MRDDYASKWLRELVAETLVAKQKEAPAVPEASFSVDGVSVNVKGYRCRIRTTVIEPVDVGRQNGEEGES